MTGHLRTRSTPQKSTIVRLSSEASMLSERALRTTFALLDRPAPALAARLAERLFFTPPRPRTSARVEAILKGGRRIDVAEGRTRIAAWSWGQGPTVYLVHGWAGMGGQLGAFVAPLAAQGFRVVTFDGPGHGHSGGRRASIVHFARALSAVARVFGPAHGVVAHSLGAPAAAFAMKHHGLAADRIALLAPPADPGDWSRLFAARLGVSARTMETMRARSERWLGVTWEQVSLTALASGQQTPALVVHDVEDGEVPFTHGAAVAAAWPGARLVETTGLGHRRLLRDETVIAQVSSFIAAAPAGLPDGLGAFAGGCLTGLASLERYLDDREARWSIGLDRKAAPAAL
jgi:pimeloyl-ACP methyl ester carboxylesterase